MTVLRDRVLAVMRAHWQPEGYTVPNAATYPFAWLWDSCFHVIIWAALGDADRALAELAHVFRLQEPNGFVPHVDYQRLPTQHAELWGRLDGSSITQPPMHGHAVAELRRRGIDVPDELADRAARHLEYFLTERRHPSGLLTIWHPWETGCDDSPRFDHWGADDPLRWFRVKGELVVGRPHPTFDCAPVSLAALVAWNQRELTGVVDEALLDALASRWDPELATWVDGGAASSSGRTRTLDGLLPLLVIDEPSALAAVSDPAAFGGPFGPAGVHRMEPAFDPRRYWRGPVWPQLAYLLWRAGASIAAETVEGADRSGLAEYWDPDDATGLGAIPQSWTGLALLMQP
jgi:hypothetical protein